MEVNSLLAYGAASDTMRLMWQYGMLELIFPLLAEYLKKKKYPRYAPFVLQSHVHEVWLGFSVYLCVCGREGLRGQVQRQCKRKSLIGKMSLQISPCVTFLQNAYQHCQILLGKARMVFLLPRAPFTFSNWKQVQQPISLRFDASP
jgi:hypothetical protein